MVFTESHWNLLRDLKKEVDQGGPTFTGVDKDILEANFWRSNWLNFRKFNFNDLTSFIAKVTFFRVLKLYQVHERLPKDLQIKGLYLDFLNEGFEESSFDEVKYLETCAKIKYALGSFSIEKYKDRVGENAKGRNSLSPADQADFDLCVAQFKESLLLCQMAKEKLHSDLTYYMHSKIDAEVRQKVLTSKKEKAAANKEEKECAAAIDHLMQQEVILKQAHGRAAFVLAHYGELSWPEAYSILVQLDKESLADVDLLYNKSYASKKTEHYIDAIDGFKKCQEKYRQDAVNKKKEIALCQLHIADSYRLFAGTRMLDKHKDQYYMKAIELFKSIGPDEDNAILSEDTSSTAGTSQLTLYDDLDSKDKIFFKTWRLSAMVKRAILGEGEQQSETDNTPSLDQAGKVQKIPFLWHKLKDKIESSESQAEKIIEDLKLKQFSIRESEGKSLPDDEYSDYYLISGQTSQYVALNHLRLIEKNSREGSAGISINKDKFVEVIRKARVAYGKYEGRDKRFDEAQIDLDTIELNYRQRFNTGKLEDNNRDITKEAITRGYSNLISYYMQNPHKVGFHNEYIRLNVKLASIHTQLKLSSSDFTMPEWFSQNVDVSILESFTYRKMLFTSLVSTLWLNQSALSNKMYMFKQGLSDTLAFFLSGNLEFMEFEELLDIYQTLSSQVRNSGMREAQEICGNNNIVFSLLKQQYLTQLKEEEEREIKEVTASPGAGHYYKHIQTLLGGSQGKVLMLSAESFITKIKHTTGAEKLTRLDNIKLFLRTVAVGAGAASSLALILAPVAIVAGATALMLDVVGRFLKPILEKKYESNLHKIVDTLEEVLPAIGESEFREYIARVLTASRQEDLKDISLDRDGAKNLAKDSVTNILTIIEYNGLNMQSNQHTNKVEYRYELVSKLASLIGASLPKNIKAKCKPALVVKDGSLLISHYGYEPQKDEPESEFYAIRSALETALYQTKGNYLPIVKCMIEFLPDSPQKDYYRALVKSHESQTGTKSKEVNLGPFSIVEIFQLFLQRLEKIAASTPELSSPTELDYNTLYRELEGCDSELKATYAEIQLIHQYCLGKIAASHFELC